MVYLIQQYWLWLLAALVLGLVIGWMTFGPRRTSWWSGWVPLASLAFVACLVLAWAKFLRGTPGLWLDTALLFFTSYIAGCFLGSMLKGLFGARDLSAPVAAMAPVAAVAPLKAPEPTIISATRPIARDVTPVDSEKTVIAPGRPVKIAEPLAAEMQPAARIEGEDKIAGTRPPGFAGPRNGKADDLKLVRGIGKQNEGRLHGLGIWHFDQISAWSKQNVLWVGSYLAFPGRIEREDWVKQARQLAAGKDTEFSKRAKWGLVPTSKDDGSLGQANVANPPRKDDKPA